MQNLQTNFNTKETYSQLHAVIKQADKKFIPISIHIQLQHMDKKALITKFTQAWVCKELHSSLKNDLKKQPQLSTIWMELGQLYK